MRPSCGSQRRRRPTPADGHQRFAVVVEVVADRMVHLVAARTLLIVLDELRDEGIEVRHIQVQLDDPQLGP